jgi:hypothetical protein
MKKQLKKLSMNRYWIFLLLIILISCQSLQATSIKPLIPDHKEGEAMGTVEVGGKKFEINYSYAQRINSKKLNIKLILSQSMMENPFDAKRTRSVEIHSMLDRSSYGVPIEIYIPQFFKHPISITGSLYWKEFNAQTVHGVFFINDGLCWDRKQQRVCNRHPSLSFKARVTKTEAALKKPDRNTFW